MTDPVAREREAIVLLEEWPWESGTTVIGGYALAAYGAARHSVAIDFTLSSGARSAVTEWLEPVLDEPDLRCEIPPVSDQQTEVLDLWWRDVALGHGAALVEVTQPDAIPLIGCRFPKL